MRIAWVILLAALLAGCARKEKPFPSKAITLICPWNAGGGTDRLSRFMADQLQAKLGQPVVVANKTGGSGAIGFAAGANAAADGHTLTMATFELSTMHWLGISKLTHKSFTPLAQLNGDAAAIIVRKDSPHKTLAELLDHVRSNPGQLKMSGTAKGAAWDLARSGMLLAAGLPVDSVVWVPTGGAAPAIVALLGQHIDAICCSMPEAMTQLQSGELRALAVMSAQRLPGFPDVPTCNESGVEWEAVGYRGLALPRGAPEEVTRILSAACLEIAQSQEFKAFMEKNSFAAVVKGPEEFARFLEQQDEQWRKVILAGNLGGGAASSAAKSDPGPWALPAGAAAFVLLMGMWRLRGRAPAPAAAEAPPRIALPIVAIALYLALLPWIGFFASTAVFATLAARYFGCRWVAAAATSLALMFSVYFLFERLFKVPLPAGILF